MTDKILLNGKVYTMDKENPKAQALAIENNIILAVGTNEEIIHLKEDGTEVIDIQGAMILPGFIDAHCHPTLCAFFAAGISIDEDMSIDTVLKTVQKRVKSEPEKVSYFGIGYNECMFDQKGPRKEMLDSISKDKPIFLLGSSGHEGWCNSKALDLAKVTKYTEDPLPGFQYFERDEYGEPTGHVVECSAEAVLFNNISFFNEEEIYQGYIDLSKNCSKMGITSLIDCGTFEWMESISIPMIERIIEENTLKQRLFGSIMVDTVTKQDQVFEQLKERKGKYNSDKYRVNTYKIILDGTMETRTASLTEPYDEDGRIVTPLFSGTDIENIFLRAANEGFDIHSHGIGDRAIRENLKGAAAVRKAGFNNIRITNAHTSYVAEEDKALFSKYNVIANTTGVWHYGNNDLEKIIGDRAKKQYTMKDLIDFGAIVTMGSDMPVDEYGPEPLHSIEVAMTRKMVGKKDAPVLSPENQILDLQTCLESYTCNAAYQVHMEEKIGILKKGAYADILVLEEDLFELDPDVISNVSIKMTICNGEIVYSPEK